MSCGKKQSNNPPIEMGKIVYQPSNESKQYLSEAEFEQIKNNALQYLMYEMNYYQTYSDLFVDKHNFKYFNFRGFIKQITFQNNELIVNLMLKFDSIFQG